MGYDTFFHGSITFDRNLTEDEIEAFDALVAIPFQTKAIHPWPEHIEWTLQEFETELVPISGRNYAYGTALERIIELWAKPNGLVLNGRVFWEGEDPGDQGVMDVKANEVRIIKAVITYPGLEGPDHA